MARYRGTVATGLEREAVFDYLAEFSNAAAWDPGVVGAERLDQGPVRLGSAFRLDVRTGLRTTPFEYRIVEYRRPERVVLLGTCGAMRSEDTVTIVAREQGGSILTYDADFRFTGPASVGNLFLALPFRRIADRGLAGLDAALSARAEQGPLLGGDQVPVEDRVPKDERAS